MFGIDISSHAALLLRLSYDLQRQRCLTGGFGSIDLDDAAARHTADAQSNIESERTGRDYGDVFHYASLAELHDRPFAKLPFDLAYGEIKCFLPIYVHLPPPSKQKSRCAPSLRRQGYDSQPVVYSSFSSEFALKKDHFCHRGFAEFMTLPFFKFF